MRIIDAVDIDAIHGSERPEASRMGLTAATVGADDPHDSAKIAGWIWPANKLAHALRGGGFGMALRAFALPGLQGRVDEKCVPCQILDMGVRG